jgi:hypothetical protein
MTSVEYIQLKAFARYDGLLMALLWAGSFACYLVGLSDPGWSATALLLAVSTPLFAAWRLRIFRNTVLNGAISFMRGWAFVILVFFYAGLLFALAQYGYLAYMDQGYLVQMLQKLLDAPESQQLITQYGMADVMNESVHLLLTMRPIDFVLNMLTTNIMMGFVLGVPIAALMKRRLKVES